MKEKSYQVQAWLKMSLFIDVLNDCKERDIGVDAWFKEATLLKLKVDSLRPIEDIPKDNFPLSLKAFNKKDRAFGGMGEIF